MALPTALIASRTHNTVHVAAPGASHLPFLRPDAALHWVPTGHLLVEASPTALLFRQAPSLTPAGEIDVALPSSSPVLCVTVSTGARFLALGREDGLVALLDLVSKRIVTSFSLGAPVLAVAFQRAADTRYLACATSQAVSLFSRVSHRLVARYTVSSYGKAGSFVAARETRVPRHGAPSGSPRITAASFSPENVNLLVATDDSGCVNVWDVSRSLTPRARTEPQLAPAGQPQTTYSRFTSPIRTPATDLAFAPKGSAVSLCVGGFDKQVRFFDAALKRFLFTVSCSAPVSAVSWGGGAFLAVGMTNGAMSVVEVGNEGGKILTKVYVDREAGNEECTAVRSVHFQPVETPPALVKKSALRVAHEAQTRIGKESMLAGTGRILSDVRRRDGDSSRGTSVRSGRVSGALDEDNGDDIDLLAEGLDVIADAKRIVPQGMLRSEFGVRDSDIFSPVAPHASTKGDVTPRPQFGKKSISFHETPREAGPPANSSTHWTPRSRTANTIMPLGETNGAEQEVDRGFDSTDREADFGKLTRDENDTNPTEIDDAEPLDSDGADSIGSKSPQLSHRSPEKQIYPGLLRGQASFIEIDEDESTDQARVMPLQLDHPVNNSSFHVESIKTSRPKLSGKRDGRTHSVQVVSDVQVNHTLSRGAVGAADLSPVTQSTGGNRSYGEQDDANRKDEVMRKLGAAASFSSSGDAPCSEASSRLGPTGVDTLIDSRGRSERISTELEGKPEWIAQLSEQLRGVMTEELDVLKNELRHSVLDIHSEMVIMAANHSQELRAVCSKRDRRVKQLENEVNRLRDDNERLRRKFGLG